MAKLISKVTQQVIDLHAGSNRIGRNPANDHVVLDLSVSGFHCEITVQNEFIHIRDLGSTNGTFICGQRVQEGFLYAGNTLKLGGLELVVDSSEIHIAIPTIPVPEVPEQTFFEDGEPCCFNHPGVEAPWQCFKCGRYLCESCVKPFGLKGGRRHLLCLHCSGKCALRPELRKAPPKGVAAQIWEKAASWLGANQKSNKSRPRRNL